MRQFLFVIVCLCASLLQGESTMTYQPFTSAEFPEVEQQLQMTHDLNLLTFPGARHGELRHIGQEQLLTDGKLGTYGGDGRVGAGGKPSVISYYLGKPRGIQSIRIISGNIDSRANQDFEIRLANNEAQPGQSPAFSKEPNFTSGNQIQGPNAGGLITTIADPSGKLLSGENRYDWVEFRFWPTYPSQSGDPAKGASKANSWCALLELQVLASADDNTLFDSPEQREAWILERELKHFKRNLVRELGEDIVLALEQPESLKRAIEDLAKKFPESYDAKGFLTRYNQWFDAFKNATKNTEQERKNYVETAREFKQLRQDALLANPLLNFDQLLFRRAKNPGLTSNWLSNAARGKHGYGNALAVVNPKAAQGEAVTLIEDPNGSFVGDINLHWNADRILVTALAEDKSWQVHEMKLDQPGTLTQITPSIGTDVDNVEGCYVPDGATLFISTANMMGVPCIDGSSPVGNIYRLEKDGKEMRQLTFEQDQDWCPVLLPNGRVLYLRWEYIDTAHYFTRILFHMNPDGTNQVEYYGSNSFWPNSIFYARPVPGSTTKFAGIVTGHHGVSRVGELTLFDITKGRKEADGVIQRIPGFEKKVEPIIMDQLVDDSWPKFLFPAPLDENYLIVSAQLTPSSPWCLYLVDTFDNMLKLREEPGYGLYEPTPLVKRAQPQIRPNMVDRSSKESNVFVTDVYFGDGLKNIPRGTVKKFRVYSFNYGYRGIGSHDYFGMESCWDARRIIGEVPVYEDGSASFIIPPNTPVAIHPLDEQGRAMQMMRTWFVGMPAENQSCTGCHESQNTVTPNKRTVAMGKAPTPIKPFLGPERPFSFKYEIQPVLDRYCVGCHSGTPEQAGRPNFADTSPGYRGFSQSYHALHPYVRRPGPESDTWMFKPMEFHTSTSELFQRLEKGHYGVKVDPDSMRKLHCWVDLNVPYFGTWIEIAERIKRDHVPDISARATELRSLYADIELNPELEPYAHLEPLEKIDFIQPEKPVRDSSAPKVQNWPFDAQKAKSMQTKEKETVTVEGISFDLAWIPAGRFVMGDEQGEMDELPRTEVEIKKPFRMMTTEVTNALYRLFDPEHDSRYIDQWSKDHTLPGYPANLSEQPVIRITWNQANDFCRWLSDRTGRNFRLPTEAEWEWAARAGTETPLWFGNLDQDFSKRENLADMRTKLFVVRGVNPQPIHNPPDVEAFIPRAEGIDDGNMIATKVGSYTANPWGLHDMLGNVAEWTASDYKPYPYTDSPSEPGLRKVTRGGSWRSRPHMSRSGIRTPYESYQPVYNVGFRVVVTDP